MAIDLLYFDFLSSAVEMLRSDSPDPSKRLKIGCLSYPDLLVSRDIISERFPDLAGSNFMLREDGEKIRRWHSMPHLNEIIETSDFFRKLGCEPDYFDFAEIRGGEIIADLNVPLDDKHLGLYDIVVDTGTLEHCFNVGVAFGNMCKLAKVGGIIVSAAPMTKVNHGFWNFSPCAYENYFSQNKFEGLFLGAFYKEGGTLKELKISANGRQVCPPETTLVCVVRRTTESTFNLPIQQKYL